MDSKARCLATDGFGSMVDPGLVLALNAMSIFEPNKIQADAIPLALDG